MCVLIKERAAITEERMRGGDLVGSAMGRCKH
jgi:hypothetical protein